jgi:hypothetical protein
MADRERNPTSRTTSRHGFLRTRRLGRCCEWRGLNEPRGLFPSEQPRNNFLICWERLSQNPDSDDSALWGVTTPGIDVSIATAKLQCPAVRHFCRPYRNFPKQNPAVTDLISERFLIERTSVSTAEKIRSAQRKRPTLWSTGRLFELI